MTLRTLALKAERLMANNSPVILTAVAVTGVVTTAYLAGRASFKAADLIAAKQFQENVKERPLDAHTLSNREKFDLVWKLYIPAVMSATTTIACVVMANRIGARRAAVAAAAYSLSERAFNEYRDKVVEHMGKDKEKNVRDDVARDRVSRDLNVNREVLVFGSGDSLCHDAWSGRFFRSNMETIKQAVNKINHQIIHDDDASITDFYNAIGLEPTSGSDDFGWNNNELLEVGFAAIMTPKNDSGIPENEPCLSFEFITSPMPRPYYSKGYPRL